jgi:hypothetical protein
MRKQWDPTGEVFTWTAQKQEHVDGRWITRRVHEAVLPSQGAVIVCDMWDTHWCRAAAKRVDELAKPIDRFLRYMRRIGFTIVHCPSNTMDYYADHPARSRILQAPQMLAEPPLEKWRPLDPTREGPLPFDDSDGGCACEPKCTYSRPYTHENDGILIDPQCDLIGDGFEVYHALRARDIKTIFYCGVHANICIPGRPFGMRQMADHGFSCVLVQDLIDVMYNPTMPPQIDHFDAIDRMAEHLSRYWCTCSTSHEITGADRFRFVEDYRLF